MIANILGDEEGRGRIDGLETGRARAPGGLGMSGRMDSLIDLKPRDQRRHSNRC